MRNRFPRPFLLALLWAAASPALQPASRWLVYWALGLPEGTRLASALEFFVCETPKVLPPLVAVVYVVGIARSFFTPERTRALLSGRRELSGVVFVGFLFNALF